VSDTSIRRVFEHGVYETLTEGALHGLPTGTVRSWDIGGVRLSFRKAPDGKWIPLSRSRGVPSFVLARHASAERKNVSSA
jgi:hypothetical protein